MTECQPHHDLNSHEVHIHQTLFYEGPCTQKELCELTKLSRQTIAKYTDSLMEKGLIEEQAHPDARATAYTITEKR